MSAQTAPPTTRSAAAPETALQAATITAGYLVVMSFATVGAWPMTVLLGVPLLISACLAPRRPRAAALSAVLPALAVVVWWTVYFVPSGFALREPSVETWFLLAGPVAAVALVAAGRVLASRRGTGFPAA